MYFYLLLININGCIGSLYNNKIISYCLAYCRFFKFCLYCSLNIVGLPDLVPDLAAFENSLRNHPYVEHQPMYSLRCALEEGCLSASAAGKPNEHQRALLRFDSQTMNWGKADFVSNLQPSQWIWQSCHNHYHSYRGFSQYDILDISGKKVADGAKVSFCLEDSVCSAGSTDSAVSMWNGTARRLCKLRRCVRKLPRLPVDRHYGRPPW